MVEIPDHIDVEPYLGAHYWSTFLVPPHCYNVGTRASFIYEFETRFFPTPVNQGICFFVPKKKKKLDAFFTTQN